MHLLHRLTRTDQPTITFTVDGVTCEGRRGDTLLTAILSFGERLRQSDFSGEPRAGFCQMGACQDCWITLDSGERLRACSTPLVEGMRVITQRSKAR